MANVGSKNEKIVFLQNNKRWPLANDPTIGAGLISFVNRSEQDKYCEFLENVLKFKEKEIKAVSKKLKAIDKVLNGTSIRQNILQ